MSEYFHVMAEKLFKSHGYSGVNWAMTFAERFAMVSVLSHIRPKVSIEIGTLNGGSLSVISHYSEKVYSIDMNPSCSAELSDKHKNVTFLTGSSHEILPELLKKLSSEDVGFILIDGDHSEDGVYQDIGNVLRYIPLSETMILMHDSFNPDCRRGMKRIKWDDYPHVHWVDFDFIPGFLNSVPGWEGEMWCGFAAAYLKKEQRKEALEFDELLGYQFERFFPLSPHAKAESKSVDL